jgi:hypothetical protein
VAWTRHHAHLGLEVRGHRLDAGEVLGKNLLEVLKLRDEDRFNHVMALRVDLVLKAKDNTQSSIDHLCGTRPGYMYQCNL